MKRFWSVVSALALSWVMAAQAGAQSGDYLKAPVLDKGEAILLKLQPSEEADHNVEFVRVEKCDEQGTKLEDSIGFLNRTDVQVGICDFNPLTWNLTMTQKAADSTAWTNFQTIFSAAGGFGKGLFLSLRKPIPNQENQCHFESAVTQESISDCKPFDEKTALDQRLSCVVRLSEKWETALPNKLAGPRKGTDLEPFGDESESAVPQNTPNWIGCIQQRYSTGDATSQNPKPQGGKDALQPTSDDIQKELSIGNDLWAIIEKLDAKLEPTNHNEPVRARDRKHLELLESSVKALGSMEDALEKARNGNWIGSNNDAFVVGNPIHTGLRKSKTATLTAAPVTWRGSASGSVSSSTGDAGTLTILVEKWWFLFPSPGAGPVFTTFETPVYVASDSGSQKVLSLKKMQRLDASLSGSLNWVLHNNWHQIAPYAQTGFTSTNGVNGMLLGGGLRLFGFGKTDVGVSGGWLLGWYKDLNHLQVNDVVADQDAIDNDLTRHFKTAPFACLQVKF